MRERLRSPGERRRIAAEMCEQIKSEGYKDFSFARVACCQFAPEYEGLTIPEITSLIKKPNQYGVGYQPEKDQPPSFIKAAHSPLRSSKSDSSRESQESLMSQAETICHMTAKGGAQMIYENMSEEDVATILRFPECMLGSDSGIRLSREGHPHPRGYGSAPRLISRFALELNIFSLEEAIRKMTSLPAETFGISDRGKLLPGYWADVVIFAPSSLKDRATYQEPLREPDGVLYVLVNGKVALSNGQTSADKSGQVIRRGY
jgi:N-acyl-D-amino-acid deacylase